MHIGLILDGNRRWASQKGLPPIKGHTAGAKTLSKILQHLNNLNITEVTLYVFSTENFNRPTEEVQGLFSLFLEYTEQILKDSQVDKNQVKVTFAGLLHKFPQEIQDKIQSIHNKTKEYTNKKLNFCFGYGGRQEIVAAVQSLIHKGLEPTEENLTAELWIPSNPDIVIRTGGATRTSNFLPWQTIYSEWFFPSKFWPDMTAKDIDLIIEEYHTRQRRFGK